MQLIYFEKQEVVLIDATADTSMYEYVRVSTYIPVNVRVSTYIRVTVVHGGE